MSEKLIKTEKQKEAVRLLSGPAKHICLYGGSRAGKTAIIIYAIFVRASKVKSRHLMLRQAFNAAKRSLWLDSIPSILNKAFPDLKVKWNKTDYFIELPNGSQIFIGGLDDAERAEKVLGTEYSSIFFEEVSQIDYHSLQIALSRLAEKNDLKKKAYYAMNPPSKSDWQYWLFEKKLNPIDQEPLPDSDQYQSMLLTPKDNIEHIDPEYLKLLESMPKVERERFLLGLYSEVNDGVAYYSFSREKHVKTLDKKLGTVFIGQDFNVSFMASIVFQFVDNCFYVLDEICLENADTYKTCDELIKRGYKGARIIPDSTGRNRKTSGMSDFDILTKAGFSIESTYNPFVKDRVNNANRIFQDNRCFIDPKCKKLINDLERVSWKNDKLDQTGDAKLLTHASDALTYGLWKLDPIGKIAAQITSQRNV